MKKFMSILMVMMLTFTMVGNVFAFGGITGDAKQPSGDEGRKIVGAIDVVIGTIKWIGYAIAVGMLVYIGIKYVMASANEKADLKNALIKYVAGAIIIVFAVTIADWIFSIG